MAELIDHVSTLAEQIGPRPATTDSEHRAAQWLEEEFSARGLETSVQDFDAPRTYAWAYVAYHFLTLLAAFAAGFRPFLVWPAFAVSAIVAVFMWSDLDTRWGFTRLAPKGPSQNVIGRHIPKTRRGERLRKVVVVAHYDSARSSLAFAPNMVGGFATTFALMKWCTFLVPVLVLAMAVPFTARFDPWIWYATMAVSAYLLVPLIINVHRELFMPFVAGANDNASGVAAMLGVADRVLGAEPAPSPYTGSFEPIVAGPEAAEEAGVVPEGSVLRYAPAETPAEPALPDDFAWAEPVSEPSRGQGTLEFETIEFEAIGRDRAPAAPRPRDDALPRSVEPGEVLSPDIAGPAPDEVEEASRPKKGLLAGLGRRKGRQAPKEDVSDWLGVDDGFDARRAGAEIGSWDRFDETDDDDGFGWKGGWAGDDPIGDPEFASIEAARIRRRVTESVDRELSEKEVWFVATGAEEVGTWGMQALLRDFGDELRDAIIINIDGVGSGQLNWASAEGMARRYRADRRLVSLVRRVSRETETLIKPRVYKGLSTDATPALARGYKAISIMAFDSTGMPANWHWKTDTAETIDPELIETATAFVTAMVREA